MIYIIGGAPRVGKSIIAKRIAERSEAAFISTDDACDGVMSELSEDERNMQFPLPGFSGTASENVLTPEQRVELSIVSAKSLEREMDRLISDAKARGESLVIEGVHFLPAYVLALHTKYGAKNVKALFIGSTDVDAIVDGIVKNTSPDNWMRESNPDVIRQVAEFVAAFSRFIKQDAEKKGLAYQERTANFEGDLNRATEWLSEATETEIQQK